MREVIKELEGDFYVMDYWEMDEFYRAYDHAPGVYLDYARWLAAEALDYIENFGNITVADKSVRASGGQYIGTATLYTSAGEMRISKSVGTVTGNSGGDDWEYYYLYSGDTVSITSSKSKFSVPIEIIPSADDEALYYVAVTDADIQKLILPVYGEPYPYQAAVLDFEVLYPAFFLTLGGVSAFVQYSRKFAGPINELANIISELQSATAAAERVFRLIDEAPETPDAENATVLSDVKGDVCFDHVRFGYVPEKTILHDLSVHAKPGTTVAIVGPTGAGKTTVINLLMRFYDVNDGAVSVDGVDIREATRASLRQGFTMVLQDTWLFCGTIFDNITYGKENATMEEVVAAAKAAHIHEYIEGLPQGYDTVLTDDGVNISKGQRQLITIARAMLADASMLILDEATSNVDSRTEQQIQSAMKTLMEGRTCFVIAHRLSTIQGADVILVVKDGRVIESGNHEALMKAGGFYASLYNSQFT